MTQIIFPLYRPSKWYRFILLCHVLLLFAVTTLCLAEPVDGKFNALELQHTNFHRDLTQVVRYFEDVNKTLNAGEALALNLQKDYRPITKNLIDFGFKRSMYWLRFTVRNATAEAGTWKLVPEVPYVERLSVYVVEKSSSLSPEAKPIPRRIFHVDETSSFHDRPTAYRNLATDVSIAAGQEVEILIGYSSNQATQLPLYIESLDAFHSRRLAEDIHNLSYFALLFGMTIVSTGYLTALGFRTAIFYGIYIISAGLYLLHTDGYTFQYIWPSAPYWNSFAVAPIGFIMAINGSLFARSFVESAIYHPLLDHAFLVSIGVSIALLLLSVVGLQYASFKTIGIICVVASSLLYLLTGILAVRRGQAGGAFFLVGSIAIVASIVFGAVGYLNPGQFNQDIAGHFGRYGLLFEGVAFSLAVWFRILRLRRDRNEALRREVRITQEKLAISDALIEAEKNHKYAESLAETRREQIAATAHDIQQPLSSLRMAILNMSDHDKTVAAQVDASFDYLNTLVQTNLDDSTPEQLTAHDHEGPMPENEEEDFEASVVLGNVLAMFKNEAHAKGIALRMVPSSAQIRAEPLLLMRVVSNLVSNAVKYTNSGKVIFGCRHRNGQVCIEVLDTGIGMSGTELARLTQPYQRGSMGAGTGLGLSLVRDVCDQVGYQFTLASAKGQGSHAAVCLGK